MHESCKKLAMTSTLKISTNTTHPENCKPYVKLRLGDLTQLLISENENLICLLHRLHFVNEQFST